MIASLRTAHWSGYLIGALLGAFAMLVIAPSIQTWDDIWWRLYDKWNPVAVIHARKLPSPDGEQRVEITTVRYRSAAECRVSKVAMTEVLPNGNTIRVPYSGRVDGLPLLDIQVGVRYVSEWRFWPVGVGKLDGWVEYICDGRKVTVTIGGLYA